MRKICTGPGEFTPYQPWSEKRRQTAQLYHTLNDLAARGEIVKRREKNRSWVWVHLMHATPEERAQAAALKAGAGR